MRTILLIALIFCCSSFLNDCKKWQKGLCMRFPLRENAGLLCFDYSRRTNVIATGVGIERKVMQRGSCVYFDGSTGDKISIGKPSCLNLQGQMTVSAWCYFTSVSQYRYPVSDYNSGGTNAQFALQHTNTNKLTFFWALSGQQYPNPFTAAGTTTTVANKWYHVVGVRDGASGAWTARIYVNGILENSTNTANGPATQANAGNVTIGQPGDLVNSILPMVGYINDVQIWDRALRAEEVKELFIEESNKYN